MFSYHDYTAAGNIFVATRNLMQILTYGRRLLITCCPPETAVDSAPNF
jgi:hypothetical protein